MRVPIIFLAVLLPTGIALAESEFEKGAFLGAEGEAAMDGAIAFGYAQMGSLRSLTVGSETTTVVPGDQLETGCGSATTVIGSTALPSDGNAPSELDLTTVVLGDVVTLNLGSSHRGCKNGDNK